jgi:hypothetical protein
MVRSRLDIGQRLLRAGVTTAWLVIVAAGPTMAQEGQPPQPPPDPADNQQSPTESFFRQTDVSGFVDLYYTYNFNTPVKPCATIGGVAVFNCLRNFEVTHNSFSLNFAEIALEKKPTADSRGGFRIDLDYGPAANLVNGFEPGGTTIFQNIEQAYVSYLAPAGTGLQLEFGKFVSPMGNEVIETKDNWNYGRSLLFVWAIPYYHAGGRITYSPNSKVTLQGLLVNGWNNVTDNNTAKSVGGSVTVKPTGALTIVENVLFGPEQNGDNNDWRKMSDTVVTYTATKALSLAANYDYGQDTVSGTTVAWQGVAGYLRYQPKDWLAVSPRAEWYKDSDGFTTGTAQTLKEVTVTAELKPKGGVLVRLEYRGDASDVPFFIKDTDATNLKKNQNTFTIGFVYAFSTKAP